MNEACVPFDENRKTKIIMRDAIRKQLEDFSTNKDDVLLASIKTAQIVTSNARYKESDIVLAFISTPEEIQTELIIEQALNDGKKVAIPRTVDKEHIVFHYIEKDKPLHSQLKKGFFDILEPAETAPLFTPEHNEKKVLVLIPGLAFTTTGERLGQGGGYYDRYLGMLIDFYNEKKEGEQESHLPFLAGLCYSFQILPNIPVESFDILVNCVVTENCIYSA